MSANDHNAPALSTRSRAPLAGQVRTADNGSPAPDLPLLVAAEFDRNSREVVRITLETYKGHKLINVRTWYRDRDGELRPGKSGIAMSIAHLPALAEGLQKALELAHEVKAFDRGGV